MKRSKQFIRLALVITMTYFYCIPLFSQEVVEGNPKTYKYFKILAHTDDDIVFLDVQKEMYVNPLVRSYILVVNISDINSENHYIVFGEENDPSQNRMSWNSINPNTRLKLVNWCALNKINLQSTKYH